MILQLRTYFSFLGNFVWFWILICSVFFEFGSAKTVNGGFCYAESSATATTQRHHHLRTDRSNSESAPPEPPSNRSEQSCRREKRKSIIAERGAGKKKRKGAHEFGALIKPYGTGSGPPEAKEVTTSGFLASGLCNRSIWASFGTGFWRTEAYEPLLLRVKLNWDIKVVWNCKNVTAPLYASVSEQPRHIRRGKNQFLH